MVIDELEDSPREQIRRDVEVAGVAGAERERCLREAVGGDVSQGGRENGRGFGGVGWWRGVGGGLV